MLLLRSSSSDTTDGSATTSGINSTGTIGINSTVSTISTNDSTRGTMFTSAKSCFLGFVLKMGRP